MKFVRLFVLVAVSALLLTACAKAPVELVQSTEAAFTAAQTAEAEEYAQPEYVAARDALTAAKAEIAAQDEAFFLFRHYDNAELKLVAADSLSRTAQATAVKNRDQAKQEVEAMLASTQTLLETTGKELDVAPAGKGNRVDLTLMRHELQVSSDQLGEARMAYDQGRYLVAKSKIESILSSVDAVRMQLSQATGRTSM